MDGGAQRLLLRLLLIVSILAHLPGCQTVEGVSEGTPFTVVNEGAPFYKYGPAQAAGPDSNLRRGDRGMVLGREFGFSRIQLDNGQIGYVDTDDIGPAPALAAASSASPADSAGQRSARSRDNSLAQPEQIPLPQDAQLPASDSPSPSFRF